MLLLTSFSFHSPQAVASSTKRGVIVPLKESTDGGSLQGFVLVPAGNIPQRALSQAAGALGVQILFQEKECRNYLRISLGDCKTPFLETADVQFVQKKGDLRRRLEPAFVWMGQTRLSQRGFRNYLQNFLQGRSVWKSAS